MQASALTTFSNLPPSYITAYYVVIKLNELPKVSAVYTPMCSVSIVSTLVLCRFTYEASKLCSTLFPLASSMGCQKTQLGISVVLRDG